jgi:oxalyl-CoA decarboxylase
MARQDLGPPGAKQFIQIDIAPTEIDSNVAIAAPLIGDIGSCVAALVAGLGANWSKPPADWTWACQAIRKTC